jgi:signal transduction histidine kinase
MVAHEIRNPLGAIRTANFVLEKKLKGQVEGVEPQLERINVSIRRCDKIITELLDFTRKKAIKASEHTVDAWVKEAVDEVSKTLAGGAEVGLHLNLGEQTAKFDAEQMRQVVINLLNNAAEAMSEMVKNGTAPEGYQPQIQLTTSLNGPHVVIAVRDNGPGIEPKNLKKIREPLFTTKSFGVGLGISAIEKILQDHKGGLDIQSTFGDGATMVASFLQAGPDLQSA